MARKNQAGSVESDAPATAGTEETGTGVEQVLDGMPEAQQNDQGSADGMGERAKVPKELRPLFNEVARLSGTLGLARKAIYSGDPAKALKALALLEKQVPNAVEVAELLA